MAGGITRAEAIHMGDTTNPRYLISSSDAAEPLLEFWCVVELLAASALLLATCCGSVKMLLLPLPFEGNDPTSPASPGE